MSGAWGHKPRSQKQLNWNEDQRTRFSSTEQVHGRNYSMLIDGQYNGNRKREGQFSYRKDKQMSDYYYCQHLHVGSNNYMNRNSNFYSKENISFERMERNNINLGTLGDDSRSEESSDSGAWSYQSQTDQTIQFDRHQGKGGSWNQRGRGHRSTRGQRGHSIHHQGKAPVEMSLKEKIDKFSTFLKTATQKVNAIQTIDNGLAGSRLGLVIEYNVQETSNRKLPFMGILKLSGVFVGCSLGSSKKETKHAAYKTALDNLIHKSVDEIFKLHDPGTEAIRDEEVTSAVLETNHNTHMAISADSVQAGNNNTQIINIPLGQPVNIDQRGNDINVIVNIFVHEEKRSSDPERGQDRDIKLRIQMSRKDGLRVTHADDLENLGLEALKMEEGHQLVIKPIESTVDAETVSISKGSIVIHLRPKSKDSAYKLKSAIDHKHLHKILVRLVELESVRSAISVSQLILNITACIPIEDFDEKNKSFTERGPILICLRPRSKDSNFRLKAEVKTGNMQRILAQITEVKQVRSALSGSDLVMDVIVSLPEENKSLSVSKVHYCWHQNQQKPLENNRKNICFFSENQEQTQNHGESRVSETSDVHIIKEQRDVLIQNNHITAAKRKENTSGRRILEGAFGKAYKAKNPRKGIGKISIQKIREKQKYYDKDIHDGRMRHPFIKLIIAHAECHQTLSERIISSEVLLSINCRYICHYIDNDNSGKNLSSEQSNDITWWTRCIYQTVQAMDFLHRPNASVRGPIFFRALTLQNIFLDENFNVRIGDFGLAVEVKQNDMHAVLNNVMTTEGYHHPSMNLHEYSESYNIFSIGVVMLEILTRKEAMLDEDNHYPYGKYKCKRGDESLIDDLDVRAAFIKASRWRNKDKEEMLLIQKGYCQKHETLVRCISRSIYPTAIMHCLFPEYYSDEYEQLSRILDVICFSQEDLERKVMCATKWNVFTKMAVYKKVSRDDGSTEPGLQSDILSQQNSIKTVLDLSECQQKMGYFFMVQDETHPGYVKLQLVRSLPGSVCTVIKNSHVSLDYIYSMRCTRWLNEAYERLLCHQLHRCLEAHLIQNAKKYNARVTSAVGHSLSCKQYVLWKCSFNERKLIKSFEDTVINVDTVSKMNKRTYIELCLEDSFFFDCLFRMGKIKVTKLWETLTELKSDQVILILTNQYCLCPEATVVDEMDCYKLKPLSKDLNITSVKEDRCISKQRLFSGLIQPFIQKLHGDTYSEMIWILMSGKPGTEDKMEANIKAIKQGHRENNFDPEMDRHSDLIYFVKKWDISIHLRGSELSNSFNLCSHPRSLDELRRCILRHVVETELYCDVLTFHQSYDQDSSKLIAIHLQDGMDSIDKDTELTSLENIYRAWYNGYELEAQVREYLNGLSNGPVKLNSINATMVSCFGTIFNKDYLKMNQTCIEIDIKSIKRAEEKMKLTSVNYPEDLRMLIQEVLQILQNIHNFDEGSLLEGKEKNVLKFYLYNDFYVLTIE